MPELLSCSDELLVMVVQELRFPNNGDHAEAQRDLVNLLLTCARLKGIAYESLYHTAIISKRKRGDSVFGGSYLMRTLLSRPKLADKIVGLEVSITGSNNRVGHEKGCPFTEGEPLENCLCDWLQIAGRIERQILKKDLLDDLDALSQQEWLRGIRIGKEPAVFGALLACLPSLRSLSIEKRGIVQHHTLFNPYMYAGQIDPWKTFGLFPMDHQDFFTRIPGLANLQYLSADCLPPMCLVKLPTVQVLEIHAYIRDDINAWNPFEQDELDDATYFATNIRKIILSIDNEMLTRDSHEAYVHHNICTLIMEYASALAELVIKIVPNDVTNLHSRGNYQKLVDALPSMDIETLIIDSSSVSKQTMASADPSKTISPAQVLGNLTKLRKLVVPQDFLFNTNASFAPCELPSTIEELGVVDTTTAISQWARHVRDHSAKYAQLKVITLWVQKESALHFAPDMRLDYTYFHKEELEEVFGKDGVDAVEETSEGNDWVEEGNGDGQEDSGKRGDVEEEGSVEEGDDDEEKDTILEKAKTPVSYFEGIRSRVWGELEKAGLQIVLRYHRGRPWSEL